MVRATGGINFYGGTWRARISNSGRRGKQEKRLRIRFLRVLVWALVATDLCAGQPIRLKTRVLYPDGRRVTARSGGHVVLQFASRPGPELVAELGRRGIRVLSYLPDSALMVSAASSPNVQGLGVVWSGPLEPADKVSPLFETEGSGVYLAMFHADVEPDRARAIVEAGGIQVLENPGLLRGHLLVAGDRGRVVALSGNDEVAYIMPARTELALRRRVYACPGPITEAGPIAEYALVGTGWPKDASGGVALGYSLQNLPAKMDASTTRGEIERAFAQWTRYSNVTVKAGQQSYVGRSIDVLFTSGAHGDQYPFFGTNVLAHTFYPAPVNLEPVAGDMHFNSQEPWSAGGNIDLFSVALHEAGHALGLGHSDHPDSVMYPYYKQLTGLSNDDVAAIQALYGSTAARPAQPPVVTNPTPPPAPPSTPTPTPTTPTGGDRTTPSITITSPAGTILYTTAASATLSGTAADNVAVTSVKWSTSTGGSGTTSGTASWLATVPLLVGTNTVTVKAYDAAGNYGWRAVTVVRQ
jgi:hypothetical protein